MDQAQILTLLNHNPTFHLATLEHGEPRVRGMLLYRADQQGIVFHTGAIKELHRQLQACPQVELCFFDPQTFVQVRVRGEAREVTDLAFKQEIVASPGREFLQPLVATHGYELLSVYRVENGRASTWSMATNLAPKEFVHLG